MLNKILAGRTAYLLGFLLSYGLVVLALVIQTQYKLEPCPLCISQRIIFMGLGVLFLIAAIHHPQKPAWVKLYALLQILTAVGGGGVAIRHWWLQVHKDQMLVDCGVGFDYMFDNFPLKKALTLVFRGTGDCATIDWTFLGFSIPQLALMAFLTLAAYALLIANKRIK
ncbi:MAG: disulfide bond formation protein B [Candidatus Methylopumilus sp.]